MAGLRLLQHEFQRATFLLLASGWAPEEHKNGSICKAFADASESEAGLAGVEVTKSLQPAERFRLPFGETEGEQTARPGLRVEEEDPTGLQEDRHHRRGLAYFSAHGRVHAGGHGRTPTHDPRLLASQQSARNQQVSSGNDEEQALGAGKLVDAILPGGELSASKSNLIQQVPRSWFLSIVWMRGIIGGGRNAYWTQTDPDCF